MINKAFPIREALYSGYLLFYLFDNQTSHSVYTKDALQTNDINKECRGKQTILRNRWFYQGDLYIMEPMNFLNKKNQWTQKRNQKVLKKKRVKAS